MAGTTKGGVTGGSGREGGAPARAGVCPAGAGARAAAEGRGVSCELAPLGESRELAPSAGRPRPANRRGAGAGAERVVRTQGLISQRSSSAVPPTDASLGFRLRGGRTPPETPGKGPRGRARPPESAPG